jgi:hypothetical protein
VWVACGAGGVCAVVGGVGSAVGAWAVAAAAAAAAGERRMVGRAGGQTGVPMVVTYGEVARQDECGGLGCRGDEVLWIGLAAASARMDAVRS